MPQLKIVFFGSSEFSLAALDACLESGCEVPLAVTTPDRKKGRGLVLSPTPVKTECLKRGIPVADPEDLKRAEAIERVRGACPDLFVVASYGKFIPAPYLKLPGLAALNVHPSLIPRYRGAAPVNWPILNGDAETGVTIMEVSDRLDAGDVFLQVRVPLPPRDDAEILSRRLAEISGPALKEVIRQAREGRLVRRPQDESLATYARKLRKEDGKLSFWRPAAELDRMVRGLHPWPGASVECAGAPLALLAAEPAEGVPGKAPGTILRINGDGAADIAAGEGALRVHRVRPAAKKDMSMSEFLRGRRLKPGEVLA